MADPSALSADQLVDTVTDYLVRPRPDWIEAQAALAELCRRLKTAEDALEQAQALCVEADSFISHMLARKSWPEPNYEVQRLIVRLRALAAIRPNPKP